jgi:hypothetical protein
MWAELPHLLLDRPSHDSDEESHEADLGHRVLAGWMDISRPMGEKYPTTRRPIRYRMADLRNHGRLQAPAVIRTCYAAELSTDLRDNHGPKRQSGGQSGTSPMVRGRSLR